MGYDFSLYIFLLFLGILSKVLTFGGIAENANGCKALCERSGSRTGD